MDWLNPNIKQSDPVKQALADYMLLMAEVHGRNSVPQRLPILQRLDRARTLRAAHDELIRRVHALPPRPYDWMLAGGPGTTGVDWDRGASEVPGKPPDGAVARLRLDQALAAAVGIDLSLVPPRVTDYMERVRKSGKPKLPANDNALKLLLGRVAKLAPLLRALGLLQDALGILNTLGMSGEGASELLAPDLSLHSDEWVIRHGPNDRANYNWTYDAVPAHMTGLEAYLESGAAGPNTGLIDGQALTTVPLGSVVPAGSLLAAYWFGNFADRYAQYMAFQRIVGQPVADPTADLQAKIDDALGRRPRVPLLPDPFRLPDRAPFRGFHGRRHNSPRVADAIRALSNPLLDNVSIQPTAVIRGRVKPGVRGAPSPGTKPGVGHVPNHKRNPPGKRTKEIKPKGSEAVVGIGNVLGLQSEVGDLIKNLHDALPPEYQARSYYRGRRVTPSMQKQFQAVYRHINHLRVDKAVENIVLDHYEDAVVGSLARNANRGLENAQGGQVRGISRFRRHGH